MTTDSDIRLTRLAKRTGCAAKHPPGFLLPLLGLLPEVTDPNMSAAAVPAPTPINITCFITKLSRSRSG